MSEIVIKVTVYYVSICTNFKFLSVLSYLFKI